MEMEMAHKDSWIRLLIFGKRSGELLQRFLKIPVTNAAGVSEQVAERDLRLGFLKDRSSGIIEAFQDIGVGVFGKGGRDVIVEANQAFLDDFQGGNGRDELGA
jgi:hypothetical protein